MREVWARFDQRGSRYASDKDFMYNSAMTSTLNLEKKWGKVTLSTLRQSPDKQSQTDKQTEIELFFQGKMDRRHIDQML